MESDRQRQFSLLLVDDEPAILSSLKRLFRKAPYGVYTAENGSAALDVLRTTQIDAALVDLRMPGMDGMKLLAHMRTSYPLIRVVMLTGHGGVKEAVDAIRMGAADFLQKPIEAESLDARVNQLFHIWRLEQENLRLKEQVRFRFGYDQLIGNSTAILNLKKMITQVAGSEAAIIVEGETGTGKELVARAIHHHSPRRHQPFVPVDCASINETVVGSELFGHVKGAFTGAHESTKGLFRSADKGTLFLDEVGELSLSMQVKLLRTIQEKEVRPVGATQNYPVDVRILAATNRDLEEEVDQGRFRQDLYFRLNVVKLKVPPLKDRVDDIILLVRYFLQQFVSSASSVRKVSSEALVCLNNYDWPGNVRELENVIRRAVAVGQSEFILPCDLPENIHGDTQAEIQMPCRPNGSNGPEVLNGDSLAAYELSAIRNALSKCNGHRKNAAHLLGIGEATLYRKLNKYQSYLQ